jgi:hypothetical protein
MHAVVAGVTVLGGVLGDYLGHFLQTTTVIGHEAQTKFAGPFVTPQHHDLFDVGMIQ